MAPHIVKNERFPFSKPAATPCHNLMEGGLCKIHAEREKGGYHGCISFTCFGAGQLTTQELYDGQHWQKDDKLREPMARDFLDLFQVQEARWMLKTAAFMGLPPEKEAERVELEAALQPNNGIWTKAELTRILGEVPPGRVREWLRGLSSVMGMPGMPG